MRSRERGRLASLAGLYAESTFGIGAAFGEFIKGGAKAKLKGLGVAILVAYCAAAFSAMFFLTSVRLYDVFKPSGMQGLVLAQGFAAATLMTLLFGVVTSLSFYFMSGPEQLILSLPFKPHELFFPKFLMAYCSEAVVSLLAMGVSVGVYGVNEGSGPLFWVYGALIALLIPAIPLAVSYLFTVPIMHLGGMFRNRDRVTAVAGFLGIAVAVGFNLAYQSFMGKIGDDSWVLAAFGSDASVPGALASLWPPAFLAAVALREPETLGGALCFLGFCAVSLGFVAATVMLVSRAYWKSVQGSEEQGARRLGDSGAYIGTSFRSGTLLATMVAREFRLMNREPQFFLNGPLATVMVPAIIAAMFFAQGDALAPALEWLQYVDDVYLALGAAAAGAFMTITTSIPASSVSREGSSFFFLKSLPVDARMLFDAKLLHALFFGFTGACIGTVGSGLVMSLDTGSLLAALAISLSFSLLFSELALLLDFRFPKLVWSNKVKAMKQNPNVMAALFGGMALILFPALLLTALPPESWILPVFAALYGIPAFAVFVVVRSGAGTILSRVE